MALWDKRAEKKFFIESLRLASREQLFYKTRKGQFFAYWPKAHNAEKYTLQSRNALVGAFTEKFCKELIARIIPENLYVIEEAICCELGLEGNSKADLVIARNNQKELQANDIEIIFEIKMSIVWNWECRDRKLLCLGDYKTHSGNPSILRSDSVLKAIGKSVDIRIASENAKRIPIIILANSPITEFYRNKVDLLKQYGIVQGFWSLNPSPLKDPNDPDNLKQTQMGGFYRFDTEDELKEKLFQHIDNKKEFFAGMLEPIKLGELIEIASRESTYEAKAEKFLKLLGELR